MFEREQKEAEIDNRHACSDGDYQGKAAYSGECARRYMFICSNIGAKQVTEKSFHTHPVQKLLKKQTKSIPVADFSRNFI